MNVERLRKGSTVGDSGSDLSTVPSWLDLDRFRRGQEFIQRHITMTTLALLYTISIFFGFKGLDQVFIFTKKSDTAPKTMRRYVKSVVHLFLWYTEDIWDEKTLANRSIHFVRKIHNTVRDSMESQDPGKRFISQYDLAVLQGGVTFVIAKYPAQFGVRCTKEELEDYIHFWRGIGYLLGIQDEYNVCSGNYEECCHLFREIEREVFYRGLLDPPEEYQTLSNAYVDGLNRLVMFRLFSRESNVKLLMDVAGHNPPPMKLSWSDRVRLVGFRCFVFLIRWMPGFERLFNLLTTSFFKYNKNLISVELAA